MTTVLVADDHPLFREAIADALRTMFDRVGVLEAGSMTEAIDQVANANDIDLVLLDLRMPGMSGVKGVRTLRRRRPDIPIAVISALDDSMVVQQCFDAGAIGYIPKSLPRAGIADAMKLPCSESQPISTSSSGATRPILSLICSPSHC